MIRAPSFGNLNHRGLADRNASGSAPVAARPFLEKASEDPKRPWQYFDTIDRGFKGRVPSDVP